jgi:hypothetical protein
MKYQTVDDLKSAQNALKRDARSPLPLPYPIGIEIDDPVRSEEFFVCRSNLMKAPWSLQVVGSVNNSCIEYPEIGLLLNAMTQEEFSSPSEPFAPCSIPVLRYDLKRKYTYGALVELLPDSAIFSSHVFEQVLAVLLMRGIGQGRKFLRGGRHSNLFLVHSKDAQRMLVVRVTWSYKQVSDNAIEGWSIITTPFEANKEVRYETNLFIHSHLHP